MHGKSREARGFLVALSIFFVLFLPISAYSNDILTLLLFGREYFPAVETPYNRSFTVPSLQGTFALNVTNGDGAGHNTVSSAIVSVNGTEIVGASDLNGGVSQLTRPLTNLLQGSNAIQVVFPQPVANTCISITVSGDYLLNVTIASPTSGSWVHSDRITVTGSYVAYTDSLNVTVNGVAASASGGAYTALNVPLNSGSNTLTATIRTADSIQRQKSVSVNANRPPVANAGLDVNVLVGDNVVLDGRTSYDPEGDPITYLWSFTQRPVGSSAAFFNPSSVMPLFVPDFSGLYVASLTVNDTHSNSAPDTVSITAASRDVPPTANAGPDISVNTGVPVLLDGTGSFDPYGSPITYDWTIIEYPAGSLAILSEPSSAQPVFTPDLDGQYVVRLVVATGQLYSLPDNVAVTASTPNAPPVANAGMDTMVPRNGTILLDGSESYDPEGQPVGFSWTIVSRPEGSSSVLENPASPNPTLLADREGEYVLSLVVNDSLLQSAADTVVVTAVNYPPVANAGQDRNAAVAIPITLDGSGSSDPNGDPLSFNWSMVSAPQGSAATISNPASVYPQFTPDLLGQYVIGLIVNDGNLDSPMGTVTITADVMPVEVPELFGKPLEIAQTAIAASGLAQGTITYGYHETVIPGGVSEQDPAAGAVVGQGSAVNLVISSGPAPVSLPPDPATVAPPVDPTVATTVLASSEFLYTGANPIQTGVSPGTIELKRAAVVRGKVLAQDNTPLTGVTVTILNHPEFGQTLTRQDGMFDMAVNGGGLLTVSFVRGGYLPVHRQSNVPWQDYVVLPDAMMTAYDNQVTLVDLSSPAPIQTARGNVVTDADGTRQATLLFSQGTQATLTLPDGSTRPLASISVRATEYTVGPNGPKAMPAELPPTSAYTYCVELSVDEAVAAGATQVTFDRPVITYVENFLNFPVGENVPAGYYDQNIGLWIPSDNGKVAKILSIDGGLAVLDTNGDDAADSAAVLLALGVTDAERAQLAVLYPPGKTLWRVSITHFTAWDMNWGFGPPWDAQAFNGKPPVVDKPQEDPCIRTGSVIECQNQVLGESTIVAGTPFTLNYRSSRVPGHFAGYSVRIPLSDASIPASLRRIELEVLVSGQIFSTSFPALPDQSTTYTWDGKDVFGRKIQGMQPITVRLGYTYGGYYKSVPRFGYMGNGTPISGDFARREVTLWRVWTGTIGGAIDPREAGLGGWTLDVYHGYDPLGLVLYEGNGKLRSAASLANIITTVAGTGTSGLPSPDGVPAKDVAISSNGIAVGPDDSLFIAEGGAGKIRWVGPDGILATVAGVGQNGYSGDGGPATEAKLNVPQSVAVGKDGTLYIAEYFGHRIRRVGPDGIITTVAGQGTGGFGGDDGPATLAYLNQPMGVTVGPDDSVYVADTNNSRIRRISPDGIITTVAGQGTGGLEGDGGPALQAVLAYPEGIAVGKDGSLYIADTQNSRVRRVGPDGIITTVAGTGRIYSIPGGNGYSGDGGPATEAKLFYPHSVAVGTNGSIYIADELNNRIRRVGPDGIITTVAGGETASYYLPPGDNLPSTRGNIYSPNGVAISPDSNRFYISQPQSVRRVYPFLPGLTSSDIGIPSEDGSELFVFDFMGKHFRTMNAITGAVLYGFTYDADGRLSQVTDYDNNVTLIERDGNGAPAAIVAPGGQRTVLSVDADGFLASITDPGGSNHEFGYTPGGLMTSYMDPNGYPHSFTYDTQGRLLRGENPEGGYLSLFRTETADGFFVDTTTAMGRETKYEVNNLSSEVQQRTNTFPTGAKSSLSIGTDARKEATFPDGTVAAATKGSDPRFGMAAPVLQSGSVRTPAGLLLGLAESRTVSLSNPNDPLSLVSQTETSTINGKTYTSAYSASTKRFTLTTPTGRQRVGGIDNAGRTVFFSPASAVDNIIFAYDGKGRLSRSGQGGKDWTFGYDTLNRITSMADPQNRVVSYSYDAADRISGVILPSGRTYGFGYDANGNTTSITMPSGAVHSLGYNKVNLDNAYVPPGNPAYTTGYNLDREWVRTTLPSGRAIDGAYDNGGRFAGAIYPEASIELTYFDNTDRVGTLTRSAAPVPDNTTQTISFSYDGFLTTRVAYSGVANGEYRYSFDNNFWVTGVALDNVWTTLGRDNDGLLTQYGPFTITRSGPAGAPSALTDGTLNVSYTYDSSGRLFTRTHTVNSIPVYQITLGYDNVGRINTMTETGAGAAHTFDYEYDLDGQLFQVRKDGNLVEQYRYDNNANRTNTLTNSASYDEQDRLIEQGGVSYAFDTDGFLTQRGSDTFTYSTRGELLAAVVGGQTATYHYDGMARRIGKTDAGGTTQYLYGNPGNPFQLTASRDAAGILTAYFSDTAGNLFAFERSGQRYYVATDQLGTPKAVTDATGSMVKVVEYDAWGVKLSDTNPTFDLPVGFAGGIPDDATGLVRFGFRDYEPGVGRWSARDPILFRGGQGNLYGYAFNDPVNFVDPDGEAVWFAPVVYFALAKGGAIGVAYIGSKYGATFADWWNRNATDPCGSAGGGKGVGDVNRAFGKIGTIGGAEIGAFGAINAAVAAGPMVTTAILTNPQSIQKAGEVVSGFVMTSPPSTTSNAIGTGTRYITDHFGITKPWW